MVGNGQACGCGGPLAWSMLHWLHRGLGEFGGLLCFGVLLECCSRDLGYSGVLWSAFLLFFLLWSPLESVGMVLEFSGMAWSALGVRLVL